MKLISTVSIVFTGICFVIFSFFGCKNDTSSKNSQTVTKDNIFTISFGSCNHQDTINILWDDILKDNPDVWIWGGDIIYADTENMQLMANFYNQVKSNPDYKQLLKTTEILGTWDDHDFGVNDGGETYIKKDSAQQLLLDFLNVDKKDKRRQQQGVYYDRDYRINEDTIKIILLDTRYFRTELQQDTTGNKRYMPTLNLAATILGEKQWEWLEKTLKNSKADFNIIMSSIQVLSDQHGFETWGNIPHETKKLKQLLIKNNVKNAIILSGDRHIAEISSASIPGLPYPLIDFTSSGLTHSYENFNSEPNPYRITKVVKDKNYGLLQLDLKNNIVTMQIKGDDGVVFETVVQKYKMGNNSVE
ncbi:MAG: alkaline phosphatase [Flavobacteriales bacterium]|nr:MAG: alkaline phosphatase [Flavobacteriales bacterium]